MEGMETGGETRALLCTNSEEPDGGRVEELLTGAAVQKEAAQLAGSNRRFHNNLMLAAAMATWVTLFGLPVYSSYVSWVIFGRKDVCGANKMGFKANVGTEDHPVLVNMNATLIANGYEVYAWCGFLPASYLNAWPLVVQTMIFTVALSTGSTVKLAWQGLAGTFLAVLNIVLLDQICPGGAANPDYMPWVGWLDLFLVLFFFLATKADTNTMMYGMSWTVALMLHYMNPKVGTTLGTYKSKIPGVNWDGETTVDMLTAMAGSLLAVVATILPRPLLNMRSVHSDAEEIVKGIDKIFTEAIEYWAGKEASPQRYAIYSQMTNLLGATKRVSKNLYDGWWETFDFGGFGRVRNLYSMFYGAIEGTADEAFLLKAATQALDFDGPGTFHGDIVAAVKKPLKMLKINAVACLEICGRACKDGSISAEERQEITTARARIEQAQQDLSNEFQLVTNKHKTTYCSEKVASEALFIFAISQWSEDISDFAHDLAEFEELYSKKNSQFSIINFIKMLATELMSTFEFKAAFSPEQLRFVWVNILPVILTFIMTVNLNGSVFVQYSPTMPSLLTLLVTQDHFIPFIKNAQRLTGVVFGHTFPLLVMSVVTLFDCENPFRLVLHMCSIFCFFFVFCFMYYASDQWSAVGCLIAGFGVYPLFRPCQEVTSFHYASHYKDIVQVIIAILMKILVTTIFAKTQPRDLAVKTVREANEAVKQAFKSFFDGDVHGPAGIIEQRTRLKAKVAELEALARLTDPALEIVPGGRTPFKQGLLRVAIEQYRLLVSDMDMLVMGMTGHDRKPLHDASGQEVKLPGKGSVNDQEIALIRQKLEETHLHNVMRQQDAWESVKADLFKTTDVTLGFMAALLDHGTEEPLQCEQLEALKGMANASTLEDLPKFYDQVGTCMQHQAGKQSQEDILKDTRIITQLRNTRLIVAMNALALATQHISVVAQASFDYI